VDVVGNGNEAVEALKRIPYDLVFMDCQMPEMDGFEATKAIRRLESKVLDPQVPVIALTAYAMQGDRERCEQAGMDDYLAKPIRPAELTLVLERWLLNPKQQRDQKLNLGATEPEVTADGNVSENEVVIEETGASDLDVFNEELLLKRLMNDAELENIIVTAFLEEMPRQIEELKQFLEQRDVKNAHRMAHTIKGGSAYLSANRLRQEAQLAEKMAENGNLEGVAALLPRIEIEFARYQEVLSKRKSNLRNK
jgi:CheY-like chemotaxis protein